MNDRRENNHMKRAFTITILVMVLCAIAHAQNAKEDFVFIDINKQVNECPNQFDLSSPLTSFITFKYLQSEGKQSLYRSVNSYRIKDYFPKANTPDIEVTNEKKEALLQTKINKIIMYKGSVAGVLTDPPAKSVIQPPMQIVTYLSLEDGKWLNAGEDLGKDLNDAIAVFKGKCDNFFNHIFRIKELQSVSTDIASLTDYVKNNGKAPEELILDALSNHKIVVYGEIHRRKASWDLMKSVINSPKFAEKAGTVFMELSSDKQNELDRFFAKEKIDTEIILNIFRDVQINGWYDRGMYEFLIEMWKLNQILPEEKRINVVCADEPRPFHSFQNFEEIKAHFDGIDRNERMAKIISETISAQKDKRNNLFIVGVGHAFKSPVPGFGEGKPKSEAKPAAAAQLAKIFSPGEVFSIFQHCPIISNDGTMHGLIRNGLFDSAFAQSGNAPIAFQLKGSPFGREPFDGLNEITYDKEAGNFETNYDAYIFLGPLESEQGEYLFYDILTDDYIKELNRRAAMTKTSVEKWFGISEPTKEAIMEKLKGNSDNKKRWSFL